MDHDELLDLDDLWALQDGQGHDRVGHDVAIAVPLDDPEFGPYRRYSFVPAGDVPEAGWRFLTEEEVQQALAQQEPDVEREPEA